PSLDCRISCSICVIENTRGDCIVASSSSPDHSSVLPSFPTRRSSDLTRPASPDSPRPVHGRQSSAHRPRRGPTQARQPLDGGGADRKRTRLNSSHRTISYAVFYLKKKMLNLLFFLLKQYFVLFVPLVS